MRSPSPRMASRAPGARSRPARLAHGVALALALALACQGAPPVAPRPPPAVHTEGVRRLDVAFDCGELRCAAWLYLPEAARAAATPPPVVVMAHGFGGTRRLFLPEYAERFARRGLAVFVFDYRSFGDSPGEPRQVVRIEEQLDDWRAALRHVRARRDVDPGRLGLWGTSLSGGHVVVLASEDPGVRATVAQVPYIDGQAGDSAPLGFRLRALWAIARDYGRALLGRSPHYVPILAPPDRFGALRTAEAFEAAQRLIPPDLGWRNEVAARALLELGSYRPVERATELRSPLLLLPARLDSIIPLETVQAFAARLPRAELVVLEGGHFDAYGGAGLDQSADAAATFLLRELGV